MNNEQKRKRITHWHSDLMQMEETLDKVNSAVGLVPEGDLSHACSCMMSALTLTTAELVNDEADWLDWYWLENEMGKRGFQAGPVNNPEHYNQGGIECIEAIKASMTAEEFAGYLKGNAFKYLWRFQDKGNPAQDLAKCAWYLERLQDEVQKGDTK